MTDSLPTHDYEALREAVKKALWGLMVADHLGDVHEEIAVLRAAIGLPEADGNFLDGWTEDDWQGIDPERPNRDGK